MDPNCMFTGLSKQELQDGVEYFNRLLLKNQLITGVSSEVLNEKAIRIGEAIFENVIKMIGRKKFVSDESNKESVIEILGGQFIVKKELIIKHEVEEEDFHENSETSEKPSEEIPQNSEEFIMNDEKGEESVTEILGGQFIVKEELIIKHEVEEEDFHENSETSEKPSEEIPQNSEEFIMNDEKGEESVTEILSGQFMPEEGLTIKREVEDEYLYEDPEASEESSDENDPQEKIPKYCEYVPLDYKIKVINMVKAHPHWSLKRLQRKGCGRLKSMSYVPIWEEQIKKGGSSKEKFAIIDSWTYDRFKEARERLQEVTTKNLQEWALTAASRFQHLQFKASDTWIKSFKKRHKICQRNITKSITERDTKTFETTLDFW